MGHLLAVAGQKVSSGRAARASEALGGVAAGAMWVMADEAVADTQCARRRQTGVFSAGERGMNEIVDY